MSSGDKEQVIAEENNGSGGAGHGVLVIVVVIVLIVAAIALILGIVAVSNNKGGVTVHYGDGDGNRGDSSVSHKRGGGRSTNGNYDDKVWLLSFEHSSTNYAYIDDATGDIKGFHPDLAIAVCQIAGKKCELVYDSPHRCWQSQENARAQGGEGIMAQYYDACVGWTESYERHRTFKFSTSFTNPIKAVFMVNEGNNEFEWNNIKSTDKMGFVDGWAYDEHCVAREKDQIMGWDLSVDQIIRYRGRDDLLEGLQNNEVDAIFDNDKGSLAKGTTEYGIKVVGQPIESCAINGFALMMRKDNQLDTWWNPAFETLKNSAAQWRGICNDLLDEHGHRGGPTPQEHCKDYPAR